jgi:uncharacterized membrane protein YkgB
VDAQWLPLAAFGIVLISFLANVVKGPKILVVVRESLETPPAVFDGVPVRRPRILAGKSLAVIWFFTAIMYLASLQGAVQIDGTEIDFISLPSLVLFLMATGAAITYKRSLAQQPDAALDEREIGVRNSVHVVAYRVVSWVLGVTFVAFALTLVVPIEPVDFAIPSTEALIGIAFTLLSFVITLPSLVHAWRDPVPDEVSETSRYGNRYFGQDIEREVEGIERKAERLVRTSSSRKGVKVAVRGREVRRAVATRTKRS